MHSTLIWSSILAGFLSGGLWFYTSTIKVPTDIGSGYGALVGVEEMSAGFKHQAAWNSYAAIATAAAALLQAAGMVAG
jgi:hypothetical protein